MNRSHGKFTYLANKLYFKPSLRFHSSRLSSFKPHTTKSVDDEELVLFRGSQATELRFMLAAASINSIYWGYSSVAYLFDGTQGQEINWMSDPSWNIVGVFASALMFYAERQFVRH
jgi:hypothetical protein